MSKTLSAKNTKPRQGTVLEVLFSPAEFERLEGRDLSQTTCVVFDILRATSSMVTALANGAEAIIPVQEIAEALALRRDQPDLLLAGERDGVRILSHLTGSISFDLGNSPREFAREKIGGRTVVMTTTNGTRALRACSRAKKLLLGSFLNLSATAEVLQREAPGELLLVCSGTFEEAAYEDVLGAGALCDLLRPSYSAGDLSDSAQIALRLFLPEATELYAAVAGSRNGRRLLARKDLCEDVPFCLQRDRFDLVAELGKDGAIRCKR
jgi:2-phosphosulfolactate phosphatase